jgi:drug/metabolite transporter (DMT)-like permease
MKKKTKSLLEVHAAVVLFGFSGLFGELVNLPAPVIVCGRTLFAAVALLLFARYKNVSLKMSFKKDYRLLLSGVLLAVHWTTFFYAVQVSSVAIGLLAVATFPIFTIAIEAYIFKKRFKPADIVLSSLIIFAMYLIVPHIEFSGRDTWGVLLGMVASLSFSLLIVFNRWATKRYASVAVVFYQDAVAAVVTLPALLVCKRFGVRDGAVGGDDREPRANLRYCPCHTNIARSANGAHGCWRYDYSCRRIYGDERH